MSKWTRVYRTKLGHQAEIVKDVLQNHNLRAVVVNKTDRNYQVLAGEYEVHVPADEALLAIKIIEHDITFE